MAAKTEHQNSRAMDSYQLTSIYVNSKRVSKTSKKTIWESVFLNPNSL